MSTHDKDCTRPIFMAVLNQAIELGKTYRWVVNELLFEVRAITLGENRHAAVANTLKQSSSIDDDELDLYIERLNRFSLKNALLTKSLGVCCLSD